MKYWVVSFLYLWGRMNRLCERIDEEIDALSCDLQTETYRLFEAVLTLSDKRTRMINFKVIGGMMRDGLAEQQLEIVLRHARGETFEAIGQALSISKATASRKFNAAITKCVAVSKSLTFTEERLESEYRDIPIIYRTVTRFKQLNGGVRQRRLEAKL